MSVGSISGGMGSSVNQMYLNNTRNKEENSLIKLTEEERLAQEAEEAAASAAKAAAVENETPDDQTPQGGQEQAGQQAAAEQYRSAADITAEEEAQLGFLNLGKSTATNVAQFSQTVELDNLYFDRDSQPSKYMQAAQKGRDAVSEFDADKKSTMATMLDQLTEEEEEKTGLAELQENLEKKANEAEQKSGDAATAAGNDATGSEAAAKAKAAMADTSSDSGSSSSSKSGDSSQSSGPRAQVSVYA